MEPTTYLLNHQGTNIQFDMMANVQEQNCCKVQSQHQAGATPWGSLVWTLVPREFAQEPNISIHSEQSDSNELCSCCQVSTKLTRLTLVGDWSWAKPALFAVACFSALVLNAIARVLPRETAAAWRVWRWMKGPRARGIKRSHMAPLQWQTPFCYQTKHRTTAVKTDTEPCCGSCLRGDTGTNWKGQIRRFCG